MAKLRVSDHALVRWLQRSGALDFEPVRSQLAVSLERAFTAAEALGSSQFLILADGLVYVVRDGVVVTVLPDNGRHASAHARSRRKDAEPA